MILFKRLRFIIRDIVLKNKLLFILLFLVGISFLWSDIYLLSLQKISGFIGVSIIGLVLSIRLKFIDLIKIMFISYFTITLLSLITVILLPDYGIHDDFYLANDYRGVFTNKNTLGINMVFSIFTSICYLILIKKKHLLVFANIGINIYLLINSNSKTSLIIMITIIIILLLLFSIRKITDLNLVTFINVIFWLLIGVLFIFFISNFNKFMELIDRDPTLTGRSKIWEYSIQKIYEKPIIGYGYYNFWENPVYKLGEHYNAHNGFLDITLHVGIIGLFLFCIVTVITFIKSYLSIFKHTIYIFMFGLFILLLLYNIVETNYMLTNDIKWSIYIFIVIKMSKLKIKVL